MLLCKRILQAVGLLHNKQAAALARKSLELFGEDDPERLRALRQEWMEFLASYDASYLRKLSVFGPVDPDDLRCSIEQLDIDEVPDPAFFGQIAPLLLAALSPSIASGVDDELAGVAEMLENDPELLRSPAVQEEFMRAIRRRWELDRKKYSDVLFASLKVGAKSAGSAGTDGWNHALQQAESAFVQRSDNYLLALFDLDHYRALCDAFGAGRAEGVMKTLEQIIDAAATEAVLHERVGQGRIMVLRRDTEDPSGSAWARRVCRSLQEYSFVTQGEQLRVSATVALLERKAAPSLAALLQRVKRELYAHKQKGWQ